MGRHGIYGDFTNGCGIQWALKLEVFRCKKNTGMGVIKRTVRQGAFIAFNLTTDFK
jgi:hypothetical protein